MDLLIKILLYTLIPIFLGIILYVMGGGNVEVTLQLFKKYIFYLSCVYCIGAFGYMFRNIISSYSFSSLGSEFDVSWWKFWDNFGLKRSDYMDFNINIRTDDATDDCKIRGKYTRGKLSNIYIHGFGEKCNQLRDNNKL